MIMNPKVLVTLTIAAILLRTPNCGTTPLHDNLGNSESSQSGRFLQEQLEEEQLESLKSLPANQNVEISKTQETKIVSKSGGKMEMRQTTEQKVTDPASGQTLARITKERVATKEQNETRPKSVTKTEVDVPSKNIHRVTVDKKAKQIEDRPDSVEMAEDYYAPLDSVQYTPIDIADYIRRTGDNDGIAMAVEELMNEGLMSKPEADAYMDEVKSEMEFQQQQQQSPHSSSQMAINPYNSPSLAQGQRFMSKNDVQNGRRPFTNPFQTVPASRQRMMFNQRPMQNHPSMSPSSMPNMYPAARVPMKISPSNNHKLNYMSKPNFFPSDEQENEMLIRPAGNREIDEDSDYNDLIERIRIADFLYKEYSLEEIIYQLAKDMFIQSTNKGTKEAEQSLQRFSNFLQEEAAEGRISKELGIRILDVVMAALVDAVGDQPSSQAKSSTTFNNSNRGRATRNEENNGRRQDFDNRSANESKTSQIRANLTKGLHESEKPSKVGGQSSAGATGGGVAKSSAKVTSKEN